MSIVAINGASAGCHAPFDAVAETYDETFSNSVIGKAQRAAVWREMDRIFRQGQSVLEINCGTGVDALHLAARGVKVLACDESSKMIAEARKRRDAVPAGANVSLRLLRTEEIHILATAGPFDGCLSNFGGLNCVADLGAVAQNLVRLLKPGGIFLLCMAGPRCAWEMIWHLRDPRNAFRRLKTGGIMACVGGQSLVHVYYPPLRSIAHSFAPEFRLRRWRGIGISVPPSYVEPLAGRFPSVVKLLAAADRLLSACPGIKGFADHILLEFKKVAE